MISENPNNGLKELSDRNKESKRDDNEDVFINLQDIKNIIEHLKMNEAKPKIYE